MSMRMEMGCGGRRAGKRQDDAVRNDNVGWRLSRAGV